MIYCFTRLDEDSNFFENKNLCFKMDELLMDYGADINYLINPSEGLTLLKVFCGMKIDLNAKRAESNIESIKFLLEHGADVEIANKKGKSIPDTLNDSLQKEQISILLKEVKQKHCHKDHRAVEKVFIVDNLHSPDCNLPIIGKLRPPCTCLLL